METIQQCATKYLRASWIKVLGCFNEEYSFEPRVTDAARRALVKKRLLSFNAYFEDVYRIQTAWTVPNPQLRAELRISISEKLISGYQQFLGLWGSTKEDRWRIRKFIKYTTDDLEKYLLDLFEGTPCVLRK